MSSEEGSDKSARSAHSVPGSSSRLELDFSDGNVGDRKSRLRLSFGKSTTATSGNEHDAQPSMKTSISLPLQIQSLEDIGFTTQLDRLQSRSLQTTGKLQISPDMSISVMKISDVYGQKRINLYEQFSLAITWLPTRFGVYDFTSEDLVDQGEIGRGNYGSVNKMVHKRSGTVMAVKRISSNVDERERKELIELAVVMRSTNCVNIIKFYGAIFKDGDCWICMELMDTSLDKFYKFIYEILLSEIPEEILGKIAVATLNAMDYLKSSLNMIHRDVKPSNILLDRRGNMKLCDFGISGHLVDSIARTNVGCRPYMAPERIDPTKSQEYDVRADVWSLGITMMELAIGKFPYPVQEWDNVFKQLAQVVEGPSPRLDRQEHPRFSQDFVDFVNMCLAKEVLKRPKYKNLLNHPFIRHAAGAETDTRAYVEAILTHMESANLPGLSISSSTSVPG